MTTTCDARIRPFAHINPDVEVACDRPEPAGHTQHAGTLRDYAYPGSATRITWLDDDRRSYVGSWPGPCGRPTERGQLSGPCTLPAGHPRKCNP